MSLRRVAAVRRTLRDLGLDSVEVRWWNRVLRAPGGGFTVLLDLRPGATFTRLADASEALAVALRMDEVEIRKVGPRTAELIARAPLPLTLPRMPEPINAVSLVPPRTPTHAPIGVDWNGHVARFALFDDAGGTVSLIAGNPGTGKSSALKLIVRALVPTATPIVWFDPKGGADVSTFASRVEAIGSAIRADVSLEYLGLLNELVDRRSRALAAGMDRQQLHSVVVVIDEWAALGVDGDRKAKDEVESRLRRLASMGRAAQVTLILATQRPTAATIDVPTRGMASSRLVFGVGDVHASTAALGHPGAEMLHPQRDRGTAYMRDESGTRKVRLYEVPESLSLEATGHAGLRVTLSDLRDWEAVCLPR